MLNLLANKTNLALTLTSLIYGGSLVINSVSVNAASNLSISCEALITLGDILQDGCSFQMTTNALQQEGTVFEFPPGSGQSAADDIFNISGNPALNIFDLETELGLFSGELNPSFFVQAQQGSAGQLGITNTSNKAIAQNYQ